MPKVKRKFPFEPKGKSVLWTMISDGKEMELTEEEFWEMVKSKEFITMPRKEFEEYYKRMRMPKSARQYHANAKREHSHREEE